MLNFVKLYKPNVIFLCQENTVGCANFIFLFAIFTPYSTEDQIFKITLINVQKNAEFPLFQFLFSKNQGTFNFPCQIT